MSAPRSNVLLISPPQGGDPLVKGGTSVPPFLFASSGPGAPLLLETATPILSVVERSLKGNSRQRTSRSITLEADHVRLWLGRKPVRLHDMLPEDVETALALQEIAGAAGNLTTDAQIASVALRLDAEVHTADLDFGRFGGVRFSNQLV